ncbi:MAG: helix-turn-helix transcriptional regulator [Rhodobiaceae bacterium]|nr:helix-turn-helix transcriptional regulator [Rhodobiaceae bacterium]
MSQLALAVEAGLSQKHLSFLETGRSSPRQPTVISLATALTLTLTETNVFLRSAGFANAASAKSLKASEMAAVKEAVEHLLRQQNPYPGVLVTGSQDLLATNQSFDKLIQLTPDGEKIWQKTCGTGPRNLMRMALHKDGLFELMVAPHLLVPAYIDRIERESSGDQAAFALLEECRSWPHIKDLLPGPPGTQTDLPLVPETYAIGGVPLSFLCMIASVGAPTDATTEALRVELFFPNDPATEAFLKRKR